MKFSLFALPALFIGAIAAPAAVDSTVEKRADNIEQEIAIVEAAYSTIRKYTGDINATAESITPSSSAADKEAAIKSANADLAGIAAAINNATTHIEQLSAPKLTRRQSQGSDPLGQFATDLETALMEISASFTKIQTALGSLSGNLTPGGVFNAVYSILQAVGSVGARVLAALEDLENAGNELSTSIIPGLIIG